ncbi:MAG: class I SAM-dependent methyltransferase [Magnetococcales bacterium]|nr:class I SAM-dependent methyltransferase [Magnetococcales bacterium]
MPNSSPQTRYSKSSDFYLDVKRSFFDNNASLLHKAHAQNAIYAAQPRRTHCKICETVLPQQVDFHSHGVDYLFCTACGHLNGAHEETEAFVEQIYIADSGSSYAQTYIDDQYQRRVRDIYLPKVDFMLEFLPPEVRNEVLLDIGCGGGHFVYAALERGLNARGIDVNKSMIEFGNHQIANLRAGSTPLTYTREEDFLAILANSDARILSTIGVIEHLREPVRFFEAFRASRAEYLFYSIPMFSMSVIFENLFQTVFPRQLSGGHTHMFTETSFLKLNARLGVTSVAEWRFGVDIMDLYRCCLTTLMNTGASERLISHLKEGFAPRIDAMQTQLDQHHFCSILHCLARKG